MSKNIYNKVKNNKYLTSVYLLILCLFITSTIISYGNDIFSVSPAYIIPISLYILEGIMFILILLNYKIYINKIFFISLFFWSSWMIMGNLFISDTAIYTSLRETLFWPLTFLFGYTITYNNPQMTKKLVKGISIIMIVSSILFLLISKGRSALLSSNLEGAFASINYIYFVLLTLPWILIIDKELIRNILLFTVLILSIISSKRTAIIIIAVVLLLYLYKQIIINKQVRLIEKILLVFFLLASSIYVYYTNESQLDYVESRFENIQEDKGSGRLDIWQNVIILMDESPFYYKILGHGNNSCIKYMNKRFNLNLSAHNDFLEVLFDYGIIGFMMYLCFIFALIKKMFWMRKHKHKYYMPFLVSLIIFFTMSMLSHLIIYPTYFVYLILFWGMIYSNSTKINKLRMEKNI